MTTTTKAAGNGSTTGAPASPAPRDGLAKLRREEAKTLISLVCEAISQTHTVVHEMHAAIYSKNTEPRRDRVHRMQAEATTCWQTAERYLRMLASLPVDYDLDREPPF